MPGNFCCGLILLNYCDYYEFCVLVYFRRRFHQKVPVLHVCLVVMAGNCFCGEVVAVRKVGVDLLVRFA